MIDSMTHQGLENLGIAPYIAKEGEAYMNPAQMAHFRAILDAQKKLLMENVDGTVHHLKDDSPQADPLDQAALDTEKNIELRTRDRERKLILKISQALERINTNKYGFCEDCGVEVGIRRLEARPTATLCIDCKSFREKQE